MRSILSQLSTKVLPAALLVSVAAVVYGVKWYFASGKCIDVCSYELTEGLLRPVYSSGKTLIIILGLMLFVPQHIYKKWLMWIGAPGVILIAAYVSNVSVYNSGIISWSPAVTAKVLMQLLGVLTALFVLGHLGYDYMKNRKRRAS